MSWDEDEAIDGVRWAIATIPLLQRQFWDYTTA